MIWCNIDWARPSAWGSKCRRDNLPLRAEMPDLIVLCTGECVDLDGSTVRPMGYGPSRYSLTGGMDVKCGTGWTGTGS